MSLLYRGCTNHSDRRFLIFYNTGESPKLLCKPCFENPDFVNDSVVDLIFDTETGQMIK